MTFKRYMNCPLDLNERQTLIYKKNITKLLKFFIYNHFFII